MQQQHHAPSLAVPKAQQAHWSVQETASLCCRLHVSIPGPQSKARCAGQAKNAVLTDAARDVAEQQAGSRRSTQQPLGGVKQAWHCLLYIHYIRSEDHVKSSRVDSLHSHNSIHHTAHQITRCWETLTTPMVRVPYHLLQRV